MKANIHPKNHRYVIFFDITSGKQFLVMSTIPTSEKGIYEVDGKEYDLYKIEISSASHPFYTGEKKVIDTAGRVEKFRARQAIRKA